jgi:hypothetical protein
MNKPVAITYDHTKSKRHQHGQSTRQMTRASIEALSGHGDPGKFGRMFPFQPPLEVPDSALLDLATAMRDPDPGSKLGDNPHIPAGFTYFGQFVDHDITLDLTPLAVQQGDLLSIENFRTPALDLDSIYGTGPETHPELYVVDPATGAVGPELALGVAAASPDFAGGEVPEMANDLPRNPADGAAVIGDHRNDENLMVAQTHLAFLKFHNAIVAWLRDRGFKGNAAALFAEAKRLATWHYQWIVLYDYVERLTEPGLVNRIRHRGRQFYRFRVRPYMPVEFSAAAFRLGHAQVREDYSHNRIFRPGGVSSGTLANLFFFTGLSGAIVGDRVDQPGLTNEEFVLPGLDPAAFPPPMRTLPSNWVVDWRRFYDLGTPAAPGFEFNDTRLINPLLTPTLHRLPGFPEGSPEAMLPFRNLRRGVQLGLPSGQAVAKAMGVDQLSEADLSVGSDGSAAATHGMHKATPLWYYILKEAEMIHQGQRLGPVGSIIVAETFLGMVHGDHGSFMWQRRNWKPELPRADADTFTMVDMLTFIDDINPVG